MFSPEQLKDCEDLKESLPNSMKESIKTNFNKGGDELSKPMKSEPLEKNLNVDPREKL